MEQDTAISTAHLDQSHPNYAQWKRAADKAVTRGELVCDLIEELRPLRGAQLLDAGCGIGGSSIAARNRGASVTAIDRDPVRLTTLHVHDPEIRSVNARLSILPLPDESCDIIILQDVIEHVARPAVVLSELARVLRADGVLYLSTPNRDSMANMIADPHFGLPFVSRKSRGELRKVLRRRRPADAVREDLAQLLSERELSALLGTAGFYWEFVNSQAAGALLHRPEALVWSSWHLRMVRLLRRLRVLPYLVSKVPDHSGFVNRRITPTWYLLCRKLP